MMNFYLPFTIEPSKLRVEYASNLVFIGSCFSDVIGSQCKQVKFNSQVNPYGTLFNSNVIKKNLDRAIKGDNIREDRIVDLNNGGYCHFDVHSSIYAENKEELIQKINTIDASVSTSLKGGKTIVFITLGTAWVYEKSKEIVANCQKQDQASFTKRLMTVEEVGNDLNAICGILKSLNSLIEVVLTISPVRHVKDGLFENNVSKGILHQAVYECTQQNPYVYYFPAYEIVVDQLRDYRFYKSDRIHPTEEAEKFVWEQFQNAFFDEKTITTLRQVEKVLRMENHRPLFPNSIESKDLKSKIIKNKESLTARLGIQW